MDVSATRTDWLERQALYHGARVAVEWRPTGEALTFAELDRQSAALAAGLAERWGTKKGDRLAVLAENSLEHVLLFVACQKAGLVLVPLNYRLTGPELAVLVEDADPAVLFVSDAYADAVAFDGPTEPLGTVRQLAAGSDAESGSSPPPGQLIGVGSGLGTPQPSSPRTRGSRVTAGGPRPGPDGPRGAPGRSTGDGSGMALATLGWLRRPRGLGSRVRGNDGGGGRLRDESPTLDDPLMILYTSGTTGRPKGAIYTHGMLVWNALNTVHRLSLTPDDVSFNAAPFYHTGGWNVLLTPFLLTGGRTILLDRFDADALLQLCDDQGVTILWGVPTMLQMMAESPAFASASLASVRYAVVGGEPMPAPLTRVWQDKGVPIRQGFGMTEVGVNCFSLPEADAVRKMGSIGFPNLFVDIRILDAEGNDVAPGETGELVFRGPVVTPGYWRNPEATAAAFTDGGWFRSGDLVRRDDEGYVYVVGRLKEMFISGGENVYPAEVEAALGEHPAIAQAAVVGVPDDRWGEAGVAFVVPAAEPPDAADLLDHCRQRLARYKVPREVRFLDALPVGHSGKVQKTELAHLAAEPTDS